MLLAALGEAIGTSLFHKSSSRYSQQEQLAGNHQQSNKAHSTTECGLLDWRTCCSRRNVLDAVTCATQRCGLEVLDVGVQEHTCSQLC